MPTIQILHDHLVSQIAAGEVVERPASVVKELLENALDAGAKTLKIDLEVGGKRLIRVADNGVGMDRDDALLAFDRHATSKIGKFEDLQQVGTLGFRGEALASIAAVARVTMLTARENGEGHQVRIEGGRVKSAEPAARPRGTTLEVASLFFNVPARRKFLKAPGTELRRCVEVVQGYALSRPDVAFTLRHEGRLMLETVPGSEDREGARRRIADIFGRSLADRLTEISFAGSESIRIWGFVGDQSTTRGRRYFTFVNRRLLRDRTLMAIFYRSVREEWHSEDFPALFLFLDLPAADVDVNVHPQKSEVRFRDRSVFDMLAAALRQALGEARGEIPAPLSEPGGAVQGPFAWQGAGGRSSIAGLGGMQPQWVGEGGDSGPSTVTQADSAGGRLAEVLYQPLERAPVALTGRSGEVRSFRLIGQYKATLILLEGPRGLFLIDQHVAHERILYERIRRRMESEESSSQALLEPLLLELGPAETLRLAEMAADLETCGFTVVEMSGSTLAVAAMPTGLSVEQGEAMLLALASEGSDSDRQPADLRRRLLDGLAANLSCKAAVKMHHPLTAEEAEALVTELFQADQPYACPHGRPIVLEMSDVDLERRFGRS